jgi:hypothetical protein
VVLLESAKKIVINFPGTQFQAQLIFVNLLRKSGPLGHFWTRNLLENVKCLPDKKIDETGATLEYTAQKSLRCLAQETSI